MTLFGYKHVFANIQRRACPDQMEFNDAVYATWWAPHDQSFGRYLEELGNSLKIHKQYQVCYATELVRAYALKKTSPILP